MKITPPLGAPMAGYYHERAAQGVHDDLYAKTIVLEKDGVKAALVALDLISTTRTIVEDARKEIEKLTSVPGAHVMISATHAHTGPILSDRSERADALGGTSHVATAYLRLLPTLIAQSVQQAEAGLAPAKVSAAIGQEPALPFNRRFHMEDGTVGWNPGKLNPKILRPAGPTDPSVPMVYFESATGQPRAVYVNYAMHLDTVGGNELSSDYPYALSQLLSAAKDTNLLTVFTIGTAGDINHVDVKSLDKQKGHAEAARIGTILAATVLKNFPSLSALPAPALQVRHRMVSLPLPALADGDVERARAVILRRGGPKAEQPTFLETVGAFKILDVSAREGRPQEVEVQVISLGDDLAWVSLPGEIFVELGLAIKKASPFRYTIIAELANGSIGYIPSQRAWPQGNYEVVSARCAAGSGETLVETAIELLRELHRKPVP